MLFNSFVFLLGFAPVVYLGYFLLGRRHWHWAAAWVALASLVFYGWWNAWHVPILLASIAFNYLAGVAMVRCPPDRRDLRRLVLALAIAGDLVALGYYKYFNFLGSSLEALTGWQLSLASVALPLGISFFTFTQIAYLVDTYKGKVSERSIVRYVLFVSYFPHLVAGPVIHHKDVMQQFAQPDSYRFSPSNFTIGAIVFLIGLFKKCFVADNVAAYATPIFKLAESGAALGFFDAWGGALAYTFQLYFDFSGYSDMAVGLSLMLNIRLPLNFDSPYKSTSIIDFWKRWHISLSTFLRDYLYIPLGGNKHGDFRRHVNLMTTMLIGGLWHGASWTFVVWGGLHGVYLVINHTWRSLAGRLRLPLDGPLPRTAAWALTFLAVVVAWVFFRSSTFSAAAVMLKGMAGAQGVHLPQELLLAWPALQALGISGDTGGWGNFVFTWSWIVVLLPCVVWLPNTQQFVARVFADKNYFQMRVHLAGEDAWRQPSLGWAVTVGVLAGLALMNLSRPAEFLYFNF